MSRARILARVRSALSDRPATNHPGAFEGWRPRAWGPPLQEFARLFRDAGGEPHRFGSLASAFSWVADFATDFPSVGLSPGVRALLGSPEAGPDGRSLAELPDIEPAEVALGVSRAWGAVGETGSLVMSSHDGRHAQLLPPTHVVLVDEAHVHATLVDALRRLRHELPAAIGLHSGPSKSADIGQVLVRGVHGPGRVIALIVGRSDS